MANEAVAKGSLVLDLDAQKLNSQMRDTASKVKSQGESFGKRFGDSAKDQLNQSFGADGILGMALKGGAIGAGIGAVALLGKALWSLVDPAKELARQQKTQLRLMDEAKEKTMERIALLKEELTEYADIAGTSEGIDALKDKIKQMRKELVRANIDFEDFEKAEKSFQTPSWNHTVDAMFGTFEQSQKHAEDQLEKSRGTVHDIKKEYEALQKQLRELQDPSKSVAARTALRSFVREQQYALREISGEDPLQLQLSKMAEKYGFNQFQLLYARVLASQVSGAKYLKELDDKAKEAAKQRMEELIAATQEAFQWQTDLQQEVGLFGLAYTKNSDEVKLDEFIKKGIDEQQIARIKQLIDWKKRLNDQYKPNNALERGTSAEYSFQVKSQFETQQRAKVQEEMKAVVGELKKHTPLLLGIIREITGLPVPEPF